MKSPRGLLGAGLIFWGWQTGNLWVGATVAALVEFLRVAEVRFALRPQDVARLAALTTLAFLGLAGLFATSYGVTQAIFELFKWLPVVLTPVLVAQLLASDGGIPRSSLFRCLRRIRREGSSADDSLVDVTWLYLVLCVLGAGAANARGVGYFLGLLAVSTWALYAIRPPPRETSGVGPDARRSRRAGLCRAGWPRAAAVTARDLVRRVVAARNECRSLSKHD